MVRLLTRDRWQAFKEDGVPYRVVGSWKSPTGESLWSLLVQNPDTQLVLDLQGTCDSCDEKGHYAFPESRGVATRVDSKYKGEHVMASVHISRAVRNVSEVAAFYELVFGVLDIKIQDSRFKIVDIDVVSGGTRLHFVERPGQTGDHTTTWFQEKLVNTTTFYVTSYKSCWPLWGDNH